jgi:hypothetical protein
VIDPDLRDEAVHISAFKRPRSVEEPALQGAEHPALPFRRFDEQA